MFKFLIIIGIIGYLILKIGGFFFKAGAASQQFRDQPRRSQGSVHNDPTKEKKDGQIKGGEYVDYEEVK
jgi:FtsZ-interacting cell division protein ZipA